MKHRSNIDFSKQNLSCDFTKQIGVGIHGDLLWWFESYITTTIQTATICKHCSEVSNVISRVPQGFHLGPFYLTFMLFIYLFILRCFFFCDFLIYAYKLKIFHAINSANDFRHIKIDVKSLG